MEGNRDNFYNYIETNPKNRSFFVLLDGNKRRLDFEFKERRGIVRTIIEEVEEGMDRGNFKGFSFTGNINGDKALNSVNLQRSEIGMSFNLAKLNVRIWLDSSKGIFFNGISKGFDYGLILNEGNSVEFVSKDHIDNIRVEILEREFGKVFKFIDLNGILRHAMCLHDGVVDVVGFLGENISAHRVFVAGLKGIDVFNSGWNEAEKDLKTKDGMVKLETIRKVRQSLLTINDAIRSLDLEELPEELTKKKIGLVI